MTSSEEPSPVLILSSAIESSLNDGDSSEAKERDNKVLNDTKFTSSSFGNPTKKSVSGADNTLDDSSRSTITTGNSGHETKTDVVLKALVSHVNNPQSRHQLQPSIASATPPMASGASVTPFITNLNFNPSKASGIQNTGTSGSISNHDPNPSVPDNHKTNNGTTATTNSNDITSCSKSNSNSNRNCSNSSNSSSSNGSKSNSNSNSNSDSDSKSNNNATNQNQANNNNNAIGPNLNSSTTFPSQLVEIVNNAEEDIISWTREGQAFFIHDSNRFANEVLPRYFRHTKLTSFQRQLNLYGFRRIPKGPHARAYFHPLFRRDTQEWISEMKRCPGKGATATGRLLTSYYDGSLAQMSLSELLEFLATVSREQHQDTNKNTNNDEIEIMPRNLSCDSFSSMMSGSTINSTDTTGGKGGKHNNKMVNSDSSYPHTGTGGKRRRRKATKQNGGDGGTGNGNAGGEAAGNRNLGTLSPSLTSKSFFEGQGHFPLKSPGAGKNKLPPIYGNKKSSNPAVLMNNTPTTSSPTNFLKLDSMNTINAMKQVNSIVGEFGNLDSLTSVRVEEDGVDRLHGNTMIIDDDETVIDDKRNASISNNRKTRTSSLNEVDMNVKLDSPCQDNNNHFLHMFDDNSGNSSNENSSGRNTLDTSTLASLVSSLEGYEDVKNIDLDPKLWDALLNGNANINASSICASSTDKTNPTVVNTTTTCTRTGKLDSDGELAGRRKLKSYNNFNNYKNENNNNSGNNHIYNTNGSCSNHMKAEYLGRSGSLDDPSSSSKRLLGRSLSNQNIPRTPTSVMDVYSSNNDKGVQNKKRGSSFVEEVRHSSTKHSRVSPCNSFQDGYGRSGSNLNLNKLLNTSANKQGTSPNLNLDGVCPFPKFRSFSTGNIGSTPMDLSFHNSPHLNSQYCGTNVGVGNGNELGSGFHSDRINGIFNSIDNLTTLDFGLNLDSPHPEIEGNGVNDLDQSHHTAHTVNSVHPHTESTSVNDMSNTNNDSTSSVKVNFFNTSGNSNNHEINATDNMNNFTNSVNVHPTKDMNTGETKETATEQMKNSGSRSNTESLQESTNRDTLLTNQTMEFFSASVSASASPKLSFSPYHSNTERFYPFTPINNITKPPIQTPLRSNLKGSGNKTGGESNSVPRMTKQMKKELNKTANPSNPSFHNSNNNNSILRQIISQETHHNKGVNNDINGNNKSNNDDNNYIPSTPVTLIASNTFTNNKEERSSNIKVSTDCSSSNINTSEMRTPEGGHTIKRSSPLKSNSGGRRRSGSGNAKYDPLVVNSNYHNYINYVQKQKDKQRQSESQSQHMKYQQQQELQESNEAQTSESVSKFPTQANNTTTNNESFNESSNESKVPHRPNQDKQSQKEENLKALAIAVKEGRDHQQLTSNELHHKRVKQELNRAVQHLSFEQQDSNDSLSKLSPLHDFFTSPGNNVDHANNSATSSAPASNLANGNIIINSLSSLLVDKSVSDSNSGSECSNASTLLSPYTNQEIISPELVPLIQKEVAMINKEASASAISSTASQLSQMQNEKLRSHVMMGAIANGPGNMDLDSGCEVTMATYADHDSINDSMGTICMDDEFSGKNNWKA